MEIGGAIAVAMLTALHAAAVGANPTPAAAWRRVAPGIEHLHVDAGDGEALRFDLASFEVQVVVPGADRPATAAESRARAGAVLAVNGGFFDTAGRSLGLRIAGGKTVIGLRPRVDWGVLVVRGGRAAIVHSRDWAPAADISAAIQVGPRVLVAGQVPGLKPQSSRRTAIGVSDSGRSLIVLATRDRLPAEAVGAALASWGCQDGLLLDGGPSTQLSAVVGDLALDLPGGYPVPDLLLISQRSR
jgi:hypothetical protein